jgi:O-antigen/teichoic acid export membrane protein
MNGTASMPAGEAAGRGRARVGANLGVVLIRLLSVATGLAYVKSYTGALSTAEVGFFFYLSTLSYALNALVFVPVDFYMQARLAGLEAVPAAALRRLMAPTLALGLAACVLLGSPLVWLGKLRAADLPALYAVAALLYLCMSLRNLLNNRGSKVFVSSMLLVESLGRLGAFVAVAAVFGASARTLMASSALALAIELAAILARMRGSLRFGTQPGRLDDARTVLHVAAPISGSAVCNAVQLQAFRVAYPLAGLGATSGLYGVVANIGQQAMAVCSSIFSQIETPRLYQTQGGSIRRFTGLAAALAAAVLVGMTALAPLFVRLLTKEQYLPYAYAIGFGVVVEACNMVIGGYTVLLSLRRRTGLLLRLNVAAAAVSVAGCLGAIRWLPGDPFVIGWAVAGSQLLMTLVLVAAASRKP